MPAVQAKTCDRPELQRCGYSSNVDMCSDMRRICRVVFVFTVNNKLMVLIVWVWCGDKAGCGLQYRECWLKHLVRGTCPQPPRWHFLQCA